MTKNSAEQNSTEITEKNYSECNNEEKLARLDLIREKIMPILEKIKWRGKTLKRDKLRDNGRRLDPDQEINWNNIAFVRAADYHPETDSKGKIKLSTSLETIGDSYHGRRTLHFTLNHKVASHAQGNWEGSSLLYVIPGDKMITENGMPECLLTEDTFYNKGITLPPESIIIDNKNLLNLPEEVKKKYVVIEKEDWMTHDEILKVIFDFLNITGIEATEHEAVTENFSHLIEKIRQKEKIPPPKHHSWHWASKLDDFYNLIASGHPDLAISKAPLGIRDEKEFLSLPENERQRIIEETVSIIALSDEEYITFLKDLEVKIKRNPAEIMQEIAGSINALLKNRTKVEELKQQLKEARIELVHRILITLLSKNGYLDIKNAELNDPSLNLLLETIKKYCFASFLQIFRTEYTENYAQCSKCNWGASKIFDPELYEQNKNKMDCPKCNSRTLRGLSWDLFTNENLRKAA